MIGMGANKHSSRSAWLNLAFFLASSWQESKRATAMIVIAIFLRVATPYVSILLPKVIVDELSGGGTPEHLFFSVGGTVLLLGLLNLSSRYAQAVGEFSSGPIGFLRMGRLLAQKQLDMEYALLDDPETQGAFDKASHAAQSLHMPALRIPPFLVGFISSLAGLVLYGGIIWQTHPVIIFFILLSAIINYFMLSRYRNYDNYTREKRATIRARLMGFFNYLGSVNHNREVLIYGMAGLIERMTSQVVRLRDDEEGKVASRYAQAEATEVLMTLIRDGLAYFFLIRMVLQHEISLGDFTLVFAAIAAMSGWASGIINQGSELIRGLNEMGDIKAFLELGDTAPDLSSDLEIPDHPQIELKNVSYTYSGAASAALSDINLVIEQDKRIAIVGANGSGKTTLVKIICGLYEPTKGCVSLNGVAEKRLGHSAYSRFFSVVFQDIHLLALSIAENVSQTTLELTDYPKFMKSIESAGLKEWLERLPLGEHSLLVRQIHENGIEPSGGELQKLAMARALYKDAPIIILDEPTAALDPIAENEIYRRYAELTEGKASIFISHRLASTRFCDRILYMENGRIVEEGTHDELMLLGGGYARMFEIQAQYYRE